MSDTQLAVKEAPPSVALMLSETLRSIQSGQITEQSVKVLEGMMGLYERNEKYQGEKDFAAALVALQGETIRVVATKKVDAKSDGTCRYKFAPYEEIMAAVQPMLTRHGFSITFDAVIEGEGQRLTSICTLTHSGGHTRTNRFAVRFGKPPGSSEAQGDMSTKSYAKRGALCDALNIAIDHDDDARMKGAPVTAEQAKGLREMVRDTNSDETKFLEHAGADSFEKIDENRYDELRDMLARKASKAKPRTNPNEREPGETGADLF